MGLETGTYVEDLIITNPPGGDDKRQGDDHLRLIKTTLRNTLKRATKSFFLPTSVSKSANYTVLESDENTTIQCDTTTAFNLSLPVLDSSRAGWTVQIVKSTTDMNPVYLVPSSGTINGFTKVRRSAPATITQVIWTGTAWVASRPLGAPVGSVTEYYGSTLPQGHLWADGSTFTAADYVELNTVLGGNTKPDRRGRVGVGRDDMGGSAAGRITLAVSGITGTALLSAGGAQSITLATAELPSHAHTVASQHLGGSLAIGGADTDHTHTQQGTFTSAGTNSSIDHLHSGGLGSSPAISGGGLGTPQPISSAATGAADRSLDHTHNTTISGQTGAMSAGHAHAISGSTQNAGSGTAHNNIPPSIVCNVIVVAE